MAKQTAIERDGTIIEALSNAMFRIKEKVLGFNSTAVKNVRGMGLMLGIIVDPEKRTGYVAKLMEKGVLVLTAGTDAIRLLPPLVITYEEIDQALEAMKGVFES